MSGIRILLNKLTVVHYRVHKIPFLDPVITQPNTIHILTLCLRYVLILSMYFYLGLANRLLALDSLSKLVSL
jgi:hypothetical protein